MARRWVAWGVCVGLAAGACGGRAIDRSDAVNWSNAGGGAGGDDSGKGGAPEPPSGGSASTVAMLSTSEWDVKIQFQMRDTPQHIADAANCGTVALTLDIIDDGGALKFFLGGDGSATVGFPSARTSNSLTLDEAIAYQPRVGPCSLVVNGDPLYSFDAKQLRAIDADGDGQFDRLEASGTGSASYLTGVPDEGTPLTFTLSGVPDKTAPTISGGSNESNPLDLISLTLSELLKTGELSLQGDPVIPLGSIDADDLPTRFESQQVLPFGHTWHLAGSGADYAGLPLNTNLTVSTVKDPGIFAQDGFEGPVAALLTGGAQVIDPSYGVAMTGSRALLIPPDGSATLHLASSTHGKRKLTLHFSKLFEDANMSDSGSGLLEVGAVGEAGPNSTALTVTGPTTPISLGQWHAASAPSTLMVPLENPADDEIVRVSTSSCGGACPSVALVIDDLTLN